MSMFFDRTCVDRGGRRGSAIAIVLIVSVFAAAMAMATLSLVEQSARIQHTTTTLGQGLHGLENTLELVKVIIANSPYDGRKNKVLEKSAEKLEEHIDDDTGVLNIGSFLAQYPQGYLHDAENNDAFILPGGTAVRVIIRDEGYEDDAVPENRYYQLQVQELDTSGDTPVPVRTMRMRVALWPPFSDYDQFTPGNLFVDQDSGGLLYAGGDISFGVTKNGEVYENLQFDAIETPEDLRYFKDVEGAWSEVLPESTDDYSAIKGAVLAPNGLIGGARKLAMPERADLEALGKRAEDIVAEDGTDTNKNAVYITAPALTPRTYDTWLAVSDAVGDGAANLYARARITETGKANTQLFLFVAGNKAKLTVTVIPERVVQILNDTTTGLPQVRQLSSAVLATILNNKITELRILRGDEYVANFEANWFNDNPLENSPGTTTAFEGPHNGVVDPDDAVGGWQDAFAAFYSTYPPDDTETVGNYDAPGNDELAKIFENFKNTTFWNTFNDTTAYRPWTSFDSPWWWVEWNNNSDFTDILTRMAGMTGGDDVPLDSDMMYAATQAIINASGSFGCPDIVCNGDVSYANANYLMIKGHGCWFPGGVHYEHATFSFMTSMSEWRDARDTFIDKIQLYYNIPANLLALKGDLLLVRTEDVAKTEAAAFADNPDNWKPYAVLRQQAAWTLAQYTEDPRTNGEVAGEAEAKAWFREQYLDRVASDTPAALNKTTDYAHYDAGATLIETTIDDSGEAVDAASTLSAPRALYEERFRNGAVAANDQTDILVSETTRSQAGAPANAFTPISTTTYTLKEDCIVYVSGNVTSLKGMAKKHITIVVDGVVHITGDLEGTGNKTVGLIAEGDILFVNETPDDTTLSIEAALLSRAGSIGLDVKQSEDGTPLSTGHLVRNPGAVGDLLLSGSRVFEGSFNTTTPLGGFASVATSFDSNLKANPPPHFFQSSRIDFMAFELVGNHVLATRINP
ncbi:hypothetical protein JYT83_00140 [bacterium AH-315-F18]|nr:hypothetical protein [bacterium AH-315-F18]